MGSNGRKTPNALLLQYNLTDAEGINNSNSKVLASVRGEGLIKTMQNV